MSISSEITRITNNVQNTIDTIEATGVTVPDGANSDDLPSLAAALANEKQDKLTGTQGQVVGFDEDGNAVAQESTKPKSVSITLPASGWSDNSQTVPVNGVVADETKQLIQPCPAMASQTAYYEAGILCTGQAANQLTFTCQTVPTADLTVYVVMQEVGA